MSTISKLNPKRLAIKEKFQRRANLIGNRYVPPSKKAVDDSNRNAEWSIPTAALSTLDFGQDVKSNVFFINTKKSTQDVHNQKNVNNFISQQGDLFEKKGKETRGLYAEFLQDLSNALGHSSISIAEHYITTSKSTRSSGISTVTKHLESLENFFSYLGALPFSPAIEEDEQ